MPNRIFLLFSTSWTPLVGAENQSPMTNFEGSQATQLQNPERRKGKYSQGVDVRPYSLAGFGSADAAQER